MAATTCAGGGTDTVTGVASILISTGLASGFTSEAGFGSETFVSGTLGSPDGAVAVGAAALVALGLAVPPFGFAAETADAGCGSDFGDSGALIAAALGATGDSAGGAASAALEAAASGLTAVSVDGLGASVSEGCAPTDCGFSRSFAKVPSLLAHLWTR